MIHVRQHDRPRRRVRDRGGHRGGRCGRTVVGVDREADRGEAQVVHDLHGDVVVVRGAGAEEGRRPAGQRRQPGLFARHLVDHLARGRRARDAVGRPPVTDSGTCRVPWLPMSNSGLAASCSVRPGLASIHFEQTKSSGGDAVALEGVEQRVVARAVAGVEGQRELTPRRGERRHDPRQRHTPLRGLARRGRPPAPRWGRRRTRRTPRACGRRRRARLRRRVRAVRNVRRVGMGERVGGQPEPSMPARWQIPERPTGTLARR